MQFARVDNPGITSPSDFVIRSTDVNGNNIDKISNASVTLDSAFAQGLAQFSSITMYPASKGAKNADMALEMFTEHKIPHSSNI